MTIRLTLLCVHAEDAPADAILGHAPLSEHTLHEVGAVLTALPPHTSALRSPSARCARTAVALGLKTTVEPALRDLDCGTWRGRTAADIAAEDPYGYSAWLTDPDAGPHGGETVRQLCRRTANWLDSLPPQTGPVLALAEPAVVRALLVHALSAPVRAFWTLQVPPLYTVSLIRRGHVWSIQPVDSADGRQRRGHRPQRRRPGPFALGGESPPYGDLRSVAALVVIRPELGQIPFSVNRRRAAAGGAGARDADLAVLRAAGRAEVLAPRARKASADLPGLPSELPAPDWRSVT